MASTAQQVDNALTRMKRSGSSSAMAMTRSQPARASSVRPCIIVTAPMIEIATSGGAAAVDAQRSSAALPSSSATAKLRVLMIVAAKPSATMRAVGSTPGRRRSSAAHDAPSRGDRATRA